MPEPRPPRAPSAPTAEPVGTAGLFLPFVILLVAVLLTGHHPAQLAGAAVLLAIPTVILALRRRAHHGAA